jgi:hypothetical protein
VAEVIGMFRQKERVANHFTPDRASIRGAVGWVERRREAPERNPSAELAAGDGQHGFRSAQPILPATFIF